MRKKHGKKAGAILGMILVACLILASGVPLVAEAAEVTDKPSIAFSFEGETGVKYLNLAQRQQAMREWLGREPGETTTMEEWADVHVINKNTKFAIDYANSAVSQDKVENVYLMMFQWYKDADGKIRARKAMYADEQLAEVYTADAWAYRDYIWFLDDVFYYDAAQQDSWTEPRCIYEAWTTTASDDWGLSVASWAEPKYYTHDDFYVNRELLSQRAGMWDKCFLGVAAVEYHNEATDSTYTTWEYFVTEEALANPENPFVFSDEKSAGTPADSTVEKYEVTLSAEEPVITKEAFASILAENAQKDVVITNAQGVSFTFAKGTMHEVEGVESYDFSANISTDYEQNKALPSVTKDNFVQLIDYNYSGLLPAEASIRIPVGEKYAGKTLYYSRYEKEKGFRLIQSAVVDSQGFITVKQDRCSTYVLSTEELKAAEDIKSPKTGDSSGWLFYLLLLAAGGIVLVSAGSMRKGAKNR